MEARARKAGWLGLLAILCLTRSAAAESLPAAAAVPLAVHEGRCECVLPTARADAKFYLVVGCLARKPGPFRVTLQTAVTTDPVALPRDESPPDTAWARRIQEQHDRLARARRDLAPADDYLPAEQPPPRRTFYLYVKDHDLRDPDGYAAVTGDLQAVGSRCQVYVDHEYADLAGLRPTIADAVRTFDAEIEPRARQQFGRCLDVDRDGRFTLLFSARLGQLASGRTAIDGFVRGSDFYRDVPAPYSNHCDMMYLNTTLQPGPHLRTVLAHEYTHALMFSAHLLLPSGPEADEEGWLSEGVAHLVEDASGYSWSNLDYRISAYLSAPERYQLVVADYYGSGLWRSHGNRGATFLFLRWCAAHGTPDLAAQLIQSNRTGLDNLETATQQPFADLFRAWCVEGVLSDAWGVERGEERSFGRLLAGPRFHELALGDGRMEVQVAGTGAAYVLLHTPGGERSRLTIASSADAGLQVTLVQVPAGTGRLSLSCQPGEMPHTVRLTATAHDSAVTLEDAAWERLVPAANRPEDTSYRPVTPHGQTVRQWFGEAMLRAGETRTSTTIALPAGEGELLFKVTASDAAGHALSAWVPVGGD